MSLTTKRKIEFNYLAAIKENRMSSTIVHMDLDSFFVSVERLLDSSLEGKPVIVGGISDRGVVSTCSYEARKYGVHSAMSINKARRLCPYGTYLQGNRDEYIKYSRLVTEVIKNNVPLYEKASIDEFYIDATGMDKYFGCKKWAHGLRQKIIEDTGLPISLGMSINKTIAKIATGEGKPNGEYYVPLGKEKEFLSLMPIEKMPMAGKKTCIELHKLGVRTIGELAIRQPEMLKRNFGKMGLVLWERANAIDSTPIVSNYERKSYSSERTLEKDSFDIEMLISVLGKMTENLSYDIRKKGMMTTCIAVKIRYSDFDTHTSQRKIAYSCYEKELIPVVIELFKKLHTKTLGIRLIGVRMSNLVYGDHQLSLFSEEKSNKQLYKSIDNIKNKFGRHSIQLASSSWKQK